MRARKSLVPLGLGLVCGLVAWAPAPDGAARGDEAGDLPEGPWFADVAAERGLPKGPAHRNVFADLDGDGWFDAVVHNERVFLNRPARGGGRRFVAAPDRLGLFEGQRRPDLVLFADVDGDGDSDAYVHYAQDPTDPEWEDDGRRSHLRLFEGGRFVPRRPEALAIPERIHAAAWLDYDLDGDLDLATGGGYLTGGGPLEAFPLRFFAGDGQGGFAEVTDEVGLTQRPEPGHADSRRPLYGLTTTDWNQDGWPDLLALAYGRQWNLLFRNDGGVFTDVGQETGLAGDADRSGVYPEATKRFFRERYGQERADEDPFRANGNTFDAAPGDYDNDGDVDLFLAEITHAWAGSSSDRSALLTNRGPDAGFRFDRDPGAMPRAHDVPSWNQGDLHAGWVDFDNDGRLDLLLASGDYPDEQLLRLFRQGPIGTFTDRTAAAGFAWENCGQLSLADYDRDGDVDVLIGRTHMRMPAEWRAEHPRRPALFENRVGHRAHWLNVRLEGAGPVIGGANRQGLGARITVVSGSWRATRELSGGRGHSGHNDAVEAAFGLGERDRIDRLEVRWPNRARTVTVLEDVPVDAFVLVREADDELVLLGPH